MAAPSKWRTRPGTIREASIKTKPDKNGKAVGRIREVPVLQPYEKIKLHLTTKIKPVPAAFEGQEIIVTIIDGKKTVSTFRTQPRVGL